MEFHGAQGAQINASRNTCLLNPVTTSGQNGKVLLFYQSVNNIGKCSQDRRDDDSAVKILLPRIWVWLAACPWTAHTTLCPCSWGASSSLHRHPHSFAHSLPIYIHIVKKQNTCLKTYPADDPFQENEAQNDSSSRDEAKNWDLKKILF